MVCRHRFRAVEPLPRGLKKVMEENRYSNTATRTVGEALDRLEVPAGKIGLNTKQQSIDLLKGLDTVYARLQEINPDSQSRRVAETQFESIVAKLETEGSRFLRDIGGAQALQSERQTVNPPREHEWWFLDELVLERQKGSVRRGLKVGGAILGALIVLVLVYNLFLAPDPKVAAVYGHQSSAQEHLMAGNAQSALEEVEQGLQVDPQDATLLITKGIIHDIQGQPDLAEESFAAALAVSASAEEFYVTRGQAYLMAQQMEKALLDAQEAVKANPNSAQAYLLSGQVYETTNRADAALTDYDKAFEAASQGNQPELAALARMRTAMLLQTMGVQSPYNEQEGTAAPAP